MRRAHAPQRLQMQASHLARADECDAN
jgi:hypothetical protein